VITAKEMGETVFVYQLEEGESDQERGEGGITRARCKGERKRIRGEKERAGGGGRKLSTRKTRTMKKARRICLS
jgi:hypothetical protein